MNDNSVISRLEGWITAWGDDDLFMMLAEINFYLNLPGSSPVRGAVIHYSAMTAQFERGCSR
jgi:hypothetical protein